MEISFQLTPQDIYALEKHLARRSRLSHAVGLVLGLGLGALMIFLQEWYKWRNLPLRLSLFLFQRQWITTLSSPRFWYSILPTLLIPVIMFFVLRHLQKREMQRHPLMTSPSTVRLEKTHLCVIDGTGEMRVPWQALNSIRSDAHAIYFFTEANAAHMVPRGAFSTQAEAETFLATAEQCYEHAKNHVT